MKSIIQFNKQKKEKGFPKLMISDKGLVVLFTSDRQGTVVHQGEGATKFGTFTKDLNPFNFRDFDGKVILSNEE